MALKRLVAYSAANTATATGLIKDTMVSAGWTLFDDQATASNYYILSSNGESSDKMTCYLQIDWNTANSIIIYLYPYWNATTHTGTCRIGYSSSKITSDDDGAFWLWTYASKDFVGIVTKVGAAYYRAYVEGINRFWDLTGTLASAVTSGSSKVITLGSGEGSSFSVGVDYQIVSSAAEGREETTVTAKTADTITVGSLTSGYASGSVIGQFPFQWSIATTATTTYLLYRGTSGTGISQSNNPVVTTMLTSSYTDPDSVGDQKYTMWPIIYQDFSGGTIGYGGDGINVASAGAGYEDTLGVGTQDEGTATGGTVSLLTDSGASWTTNEFADKAIVITAGTAAGDVRKISSNTSTGIVPDDDFSSSPDATSEYSIYDEVWRYFYFGATSQARAFREV